MPTLSSSDGGVEGFAAPDGSRPRMCIRSRLMTVKARETVDVARRERWRIVAAVGAIVLLASQAVAWRSLRRAVEAAHRSEAEVLLARLRDAAMGGGSAEARLEGFLEGQRPAGLVFVRVYVPWGPLEAGDDPGGDPLSGATGEAQVVARGDLVHARWTPPAPPSPPPKRGGPRAHMPPGWSPGWGSPAPGRRPPSLEIAFRPQLGPPLARDARTGLLASLAGAAFLVLLAFALTRAQREREAAAARAARDRQLAALGEMTAVLAHEIRNPLASLKGHAQLLEERLDGASRDKAERIVADAQRLETLTRQLLAFVRTGTVHATPLDLAALARSVADAARGAVTVEGYARAEADATLLRQALSNLVSNAVAAGGPVSIVLRREGALVALDVLDRGPGLPEDVARLFEPFHTTRTQGTGLGLAIAKRVMEAHAGWIEAGDREGGGARFSLVLPEAD